VLFQFALFLTIGVMLYAYYKFFPLTTKLASNDQIFPTFIVQRFAAWGSRTGDRGDLRGSDVEPERSLNSLASSTVLDFYKPLIKPNASDEALVEAFAAG